MENEKYPLYINRDGYVRSFYIRDANKCVYVNKEEVNKTISIEKGYAWKYVDGHLIKVLLLTDECLKMRREIECFRIIDNRSAMWYNHLTDDQKQELEEWYQAWLDITKTKIIPEKPEWL